MYEPLKVFTYIGAVLFLIGFAVSVRFLYYYFFDYEPGKIQSLILSSVLMIVGFQIILIGLLADAMSGMRNSTAPSRSPKARYGPVSQSNPLAGSPKSYASFCSERRFQRRGCSSATLTVVWS